MPKAITTIFGKAVRQVALLRGGGSALPGLFVEKIDSSFVPDTLSQLPRGVVLVSGTNGKTTTTKMVVELLKGQGLKVFTNRTGSNFVRGVAAALLGEVNLKGELDADIAVLELDEAHAVKFVEIIKPRYSLLLNVMRDQLDRFGEIDTTARMLRAIAENTTETVIVNREDPRLRAIGEGIAGKDVSYFGLSAELLKEFPSDDDMRSGRPASENSLPATVTLNSIDDDTAEFEINNKKYQTNLQLRGVYNIYNAAAAMAATLAIQKDELNTDKLMDSLAQVRPAFGRGESLTVNGQPLELVLVKNPAGFRLSLSSFDPKGYATMIAINDNYADGRDMSWLWDVDFDSLRENGVSHVTGVRAYDMALRLYYEEVTVASIEPSLGLALSDFIKQNQDLPKRIYCTYTAMLALRRELSKITDVEAIS